MRKFLLAMMVVGSLFAVFGCGEKSDEEKVKDAASEAQEEAEAAKEGALKKLGDIGK